MRESGDIRRKRKENDMLSHLFFSNSTICFSVLIIAPFRRLSKFYFHFSQSLVSRQSPILKFTVCYHLFLSSFHCLHFIPPVWTCGRQADRFTGGSHLQPREEKHSGGCLVVSTLFEFFCQSARATSLIKHGRKCGPINNLYRSALSAFFKWRVASRLGSSAAS